MPAGVLLNDLVSGLRAKTGKSLNVAMGVSERDTLVSLLQQKQQYLYAAYDWPVLEASFTVPLVAGTTSYNYPSGLAFDYINNVWCQETTPAPGRYLRLEYGIEPEHYNCQAQGDQGWPIERWMVKDDPTLASGVMFDVWPTPSQAGIVLFRGRRALKPLVSNSDTCTLDSDLIILFTAADILARQKAEDAPTVLADAQRHMRNIARRQTGNKKSPIILGGGVARGVYLRPGIDYIPS